MKQVQINKQKVKIFEEKELREKFNLKEEEIQLILNYQRKFPELLIEEGEGFCIDSEKLWSSLGKPQGKYADWIKRKIGIFTINKDYKEFYILPKKVDGLKLENVKNLSPQQLSRRGISTRHKLTLDCAKHLALTTGSDKNSSEQVISNGKLVRDYFILMERTLRNNEEWNTSRKDEKVNWNAMSDAIKEWCIRNDYDSEERAFYTREANMINEVLLGYKAADINSMLKNDDRLTRNHLDIRINKAINDIQQFNINLLSANMSFDNRKQIIINTCEGRYSELKGYFLEIVHK